MWFVKGDDSTNFYICSIPTDMRKGREGLATIVREYFRWSVCSLRNMRPWLIFIKLYQKSWNLRLLP